MLPCITVIEDTEETERVKEGGGKGGREGENFHGEESIHAVPSLQIIF